MVPADDRDGTGEERRMDGDIPSEFSMSSVRARMAARGVEIWKAVRGWGARGDGSILGRLRECAGRQGRWRT
jgi:hypothetical protein